MSCQFLEATVDNLKNCPGNFDWEGTDDKKQYKISKKIHGNIPPVSNNVTYTLNRYGYRCPEFNKIDWTNSIVTLGCSHTLGIGINNDETYSNLLQESLNIPVINLGQGGTDLWYQIYNAIEVMKLNVRGVILQVPSKERLTIFKGNNKSLSMGPWNIVRYKQMVDLWGNNKNLQQWHLFGYDYIKKILGDKLLYSFSITDPDLPIEHIRGVDKARDLGHYGIKTNQLIAKRITEELQHELN